MKIKIVAKYIAKFNKNGVDYRQFVTNYSDTFAVKADYIGLNLEEGKSYLIEVEPRFWESNDGKKVPFFGFKVITRI